MDAKFWNQRWSANEIGFHQSKTNPLLVTYFKVLPIMKSSRVFVPLCGKTLDIAWLLSNGYRVAGVELSELAVRQLFVALGFEPEITDIGNLKQYSAADIDIFVGDIFELSGKLLGSIDASFDRAALVALPENLRGRYSKHLAEITATASQLLITYEYEQSLMNGPPFSISNQEIHSHYGNNYEILSMASVKVDGGLKGICAAKENVWLLNPL